MNSFSFRSIFAAMLLSVVLLPNLRSNDLDETKVALESTLNQLLDVLHANHRTAPYSVKKDQIIGILNQQFSFDVIIQRSLGRNWNKLNDSQKDQVYALITDLVLQSYTRELQDGPRPQLTFYEPKVITSSKIEIESLVLLNESKINISYRMANIKDRGWQVYDVLVEGVSMVSNYRKQFDEHFLKKSASELIDLLKSKLKEA
jgi:phospholipid transport system substrate-binding protein